MSQKRGDDFLRSIFRSSLLEEADMPAYLFLVSLLPHIQRQRSQDLGQKRRTSRQADYASSTVSNACAQPQSLSRQQAGKSTVQRVVYRVVTC